MSSAVKGNLVSFGYACVHVVYIFISLFVYGTYFAETFALFTVVHEKFDGNGTLRMREEVSGYLTEMERSTCIINSTNRNCSITYQDNPSAMDYVLIALVPLFANYIICMVILTYQLFRPLSRRTRTYQLLISYVILTYICFSVVHILYVELVGEDVGFNWNHMSPTFYIGFVNAILTAFVSIVCIMVIHKGARYYIQKKGLAYMEYIISKPDSTEDRCHENCGKDGQCTCTSMSDQSLSTRHTDNQCYVTDIQRMVETLWDPEKVGFGRDARGLHHSSIKIDKIVPVGNDSAFQSYLKKKKVIESRVSKLGKELISPGKFPGMRPIYTSKFVDSNSCLGNILNSNINEYYLFHGTPIDNLEHIERDGIAKDKFRFSQLGQGIYFSDDPVKADQYTGKKRDRKDEPCCMIACRVLLGDTVIIRRTADNHTITSQATSPPCKSCLKPEPGCRCSGPTTKFDSVIFEGMLFRDFIVYEPCSCFPEFAIMYTRVHY